MSSSTTNGKRGFFWITVGVLFFVFLYLIRSILLPFVAGIFIAYFLNPAADKLERLGVSRGLSTALIITWFFIALIVLLTLVSPLLINQVSGLITALPGYVADIDREFKPALKHWLGGLPMVDTNSISSTMTTLSGLLLKVGGDFIARIFQSGIAFVNIVSLILITPVVAFYLLLDWHEITARMNALLPREHAATIRSQLTIIDRTLSGFVRGQLNVCLIMALYYTVLLSVFELKFSIVVGIATGFLIIVPYAGWMLGTLIGVGIAFFQFDHASHVVAILSVFLTGMVLESYYLTPKLVGRQVGLHPVWIIFGMLSGAALFGFVGVLLAVPITAVIGVLIRFALQRYLQSSYYQGE